MWICGNNLSKHLFLCLHFQLLETIFQKLPLHDRLICKEVCERWYSLLMKRAIFRNDRHIYLKDCQIRPNRAPMSVFMDAKYPYEILTIQCNVKYDCLNSLHHFGQILGSSVKEIVFAFFYHDSRELCSILYDMPLVKSITFDRFRVYQATSVFALLHRQRPTFVLSGLETLSIINQVDKAPLEMDTNLNEIKQFIRKGAQIIVGYLNLRGYHTVENMLLIMEDSKILDVSIAVSNRSDAEMKVLLDTKNLNCNRINFMYSSQEWPYSYLEAFLNKHQHLNGISLTCGYLPPNISFPKITELHLELEQPLASLKPLDTLVNLHTLGIWQKTGDCGFGDDHEPITLKKLKRLEADTMWTCDKCLEALANSFANLKSAIMITAHPMQSKEIQMIFNNWRYLEFVHINCHSFEFQDEAFEDFDSPRVYLGKLEITSNVKLKISDHVIGKMNESFPNLESISLYDRDTSRSYGFYARN